MEGHDVAAYFANIITLISDSVIDLDKSKYFYYELDDDQKFLSVSTYFLKRDLIKDNDFFRIKNNLRVKSFEQVHR